MLLLFTLMMEAIRSSETSVLTRATLRHIPEHDILQLQLFYDNTMQLLRFALIYYWRHVLK
jgi:hypothetical protein